MPETEEDPCWERLLRKQLLLLATLVLSAPYVAGINPPGGVWQENGFGHKAGTSILLATNRHRYLVFSYCNSTALAASVVVIFLLLLMKAGRGHQFVLLRIVMVLDQLGLLVAYVAGSSPDSFFTKSAVWWLVCLLVCSIGLPLFIRLRSFSRQQEEFEELDYQAALRPKDRHRIVTLLASFVAVITYVAGLSSTGGYWGRIKINNQQGDDALVYKVRFKVFLLFNSVAFLASLFTVLQLRCAGVSETVLPLSSSCIRRWFTLATRSVVPYVPILGMVLSLPGAYAMGTCRNTDTTVFVLCLIAAFLAYIFTMIVMICTAWWRGQSSSDATTSRTDGGAEQEERVGSSVLVQLGSNAILRNEESRKVKSLILLLATLSATVTYQAGLHPPGGVWPNDLNGHRAGYPILLSTQPSRYRTFLYCNSGAFLLSMAAILLLLARKEEICTTLLVSMILDMVALMCAYAAGSWWDGKTSIYVVAMAMACVVIIYLMIHLFCVRTMEIEGTRLMKKGHKRLLLVGILVATITYQAGLNPPGGFRPPENGNAASVVLLMDNYPRRFRAFFYCNTVSFMVTLALILFFTSPNLYRRAVRCYALYGCIVLALLCLMAAYAAAIVKRVHTYAYVFVLLAVAVSAVCVHAIQSRAFLLKKEHEAEEEEEDQDTSSAVFGHAHMSRSRPRPRPISRQTIQLRSLQEVKYRQVLARHKHFVLLAVLAASATYQAGLNPPGGLWQDKGNHGDEGSPVLYDRYRQRYLAFFYSNTTSFMASLFVIALQLQQILPWGHQAKHTKLLVRATDMALMLALLGLMAAYVAGAARGWKDTIAMVVLVLICMTIHTLPLLTQAARDLANYCKAKYGTL